MPHLFCPQRKIRKSRLSKGVDNDDPPLPTWYGLHPLVVHFPIALLLTAPVLVVLAILFRNEHRSCAVAALTIMILGCVSAFVAAASGEAAGQVADRSEDINRVMAEHEKLAETVCVVFSILTVTFAGLTFLPVLLKKELSSRLRTIATSMFLAVYFAAGLLVVNTGHLGGRLVHEFGVKSIVAK